MTNSPGIKRIFVHCDSIITQSYITWTPTRGHVENVIMMVITMQAMSLNFALAQKGNTSFTVDMRVIFHINDILNDSL